MPIFKVSLRLASDTANTPRRKWSNTFYYDAATAQNAAGAWSGTWVSNLRSAARTNVFCYEVYATDRTPNTENFATLAVPSGSQRGTIAIPAGGQPYMPKVCLSVALNVLNSRPSRKFWRPGLYEEDIDFGVAVNAGLVSQVSAAFQAALTSLGASWVDPDGQTFSGLGPIRLTTREFGKEATNLVPAGPV